MLHGAGPKASLKAGSVTQCAIFFDVRSGPGSARHSTGKAFTASEPPRNRKQEEKHDSWLTAVQAAAYGPGPNFRGASRMPGVYSCIREEGVTSQYEDMSFLP